MFANEGFGSPYHVIGLLLIASLLTQPVGCTTKLTEGTARPAASYAGFQEKSGLLVAVSPLTDAGQVEAEFGYDMLASGAVPILIVAENRGSESYMVRREAVRLRGVARDTADEHNGSGAARTMDAALPVFVLVPVAGMVLAVVGGKMLSDASVIERAVKVKGWHSTTLSPGESAHGYLYFQRPEEDHESVDWVLYVSAENPRDRSRLEFNFSIGDQ